MTKKTWFERLLGDNQECSNGQLVIKTTEAVIFQLLEDGSSRYITNHIPVYLLHGINKDLLLKLGFEYWEGFVGYVIYFTNGTFQRYAGTLEEVTKQMTKDFPDTVTLR